MKTAAIALSVGIGLVSGVAFAQTGATDPMTHLRACSLMERAARLECLEKLSRTAGSPIARGRLLDCQRDHFAGGLYADRHRHHVFSRFDLAL